MEYILFYSVRVTQSCKLSRKNHRRECKRFLNNSVSKGLSCSVYDSYSLQRFTRNAFVFEEKNKKYIKRIWNWILYRDFTINTAFEAHTAESNSHIHYKQKYSLKRVIHIWKKTDIIYHNISCMKILPKLNVVHSLISREKYIIEYFIILIYL